MSPLDIRIRAVLSEVGPKIRSAIDLLAGWFKRGNKLGGNHCYLD